MLRKGRTAQTARMPDSLTYQPSRRAFLSRTPTCNRQGSFLLSEPRGRLLTSSEGWGGGERIPAAEGGVMPPGLQCTGRGGRSVENGEERLSLSERAPWWLPPSESPGEARSDTPLHSLIPPGTIGHKMKHC